MYAAYILQEVKHNVLHQCKKSSKIHELNRYSEHIVPAPLMKEIILKYIVSIYFYDLDIFSNLRSEKQIIKQAI